MSLQVGSYNFQVGGAGGTTLQRSDAAADEGTGTLARALEQSDSKPKDRATAGAEAVEEASETTAGIERAVALCQGAAEGKVLDPVQLGLEVGSLLDLLERLDKGKKPKKALRLARALATVLMLLRRWSQLVQTLRLGLRAATELGDAEGVARARHELGTLRIAAGDSSAPSARLLPVAGLRAGKQHPGPEREVDCRQPEENRRQ